MIPRGAEILVAIMSHSKPVVATGEVDALMAEDVQFCALTETKRRRRRDRRSIVTGG
jgi:hypothetical protein